MSLFTSVKDGLLLCKLINDAIKDTIDERVLNKGDNLNIYKMTENQSVAINSAKAIGCNGTYSSIKDRSDLVLFKLSTSVRKISSMVSWRQHHWLSKSNISKGTPHLVLGLIWQIVKIGLFSKINLVNHPELYRLLEEGETIEDLLKLPIDQILLRWFNYHVSWFTVRAQ